MVGVENTSTVFGLRILPSYYVSTENSLTTYFMGNLGFNKTYFGAVRSADAGLTANLYDYNTDTQRTDLRVSASFYF